MTRRYSNKKTYRRRANKTKRRSKKGKRYSRRVKRSKRVLRGGSASAGAKKTSFNTKSSVRDYNPTDDHAKCKLGTAQGQWPGMVRRSDPNHIVTCRGVPEGDCGETMGSIGCKWDEEKGCLPEATEGAVKEGDGLLPSTPIALQVERLILTAFDTGFGGKLPAKFPISKIVDEATLDAAIEYHEIPEENLIKILEYINEVVTTLQDKGSFSLKKSGMSVPRAAVATVGRLRDNLGYKLSAAMPSPKKNKAE